MFDITIIGAGSAGISAAIYATSRNMKTLLIEQESQMGGLIRNISTVTHFVGANEKESGPDFIERISSQLSQSDISYVSETVRHINQIGDVIEIETGNNKYLSKKLIIAAGTTQNEITCEDKNSIFKKCVSHCAVDAAKTYTGKDVFVIGGSDGAAKEALYLSNFAKTVTMIVLEKELISIASFREMIESTENIQVITDSSLTKIIGETQLEKVEIKNNSTGETSELIASGGGIFVYIGSSPNTSWCDGIELQNGYIPTNESMQTNIPNIYAVGDIRAKTVRQIATAVAEGAIAGIHASVSIK